MNTNNWITITSGSSGSGNDTVYYSVDANPDTSQRTGRMTVAGLTFDVIQAGNTASFPFDGSYSGSGTGTLICPGSSGPISFALAFRVSASQISILEPGIGSGSISNSGSATFTAGDAGSSCPFSGTFVVTGSGAVQASGRWSCPNVDCNPGAGSESGTWSTAKQ